MFSDIYGTLKALRVSSWLYQWVRTRMAVVRTTTVLLWELMLQELLGPPERKRGVQND